MESRTEGLQPIDPHKHEERLLFEFNHQVNGDGKRLKVFLRPKDVSVGTLWRFIVETDEGIPIASMRGVIEKGEDGLTEFSAHVSNNISKLINDGSHIPNVVAATISELLDRGAVARWYSDNSAALSEDAIGLYSESLSRDNRLLVTEPSAQTKYRYMVTARPKTTPVI